MIEYANNITTGKKWKWPAMSIDSTKPIIERERDGPTRMPKAW